MELTGFPHGESKIESLGPALGRFLSWAVQKLSFGTVITRNRRLVVLDRVNLTPGHTLHLIRTDGGTLLVATHSKGCTLIDRHPNEDAGKGLLANAIC